MTMTASVIAGRVVPSISVAPVMTVNRGVLRPRGHTRGSEHEHEHQPNELHEVCDL